MFCFCSVLNLLKTVLLCEDWDSEYVWGLSVAAGEVCLKI